MVNSQDHMKVPERCQTYSKFPQIKVHFATALNLFVSVLLFVSGCRNEF